MVLERRGAGALLALTIMLLLSACGLLSFREGSFDVGIAAFGLGATLLMLLGYNLAAIIFRHIDRITLVICFFLCSVGLIMLARLDMETAVRQLIFLAASCVVMFIAVAVIRRTRDFGKLNYLFMVGAVGLLMLSLVFGRATGGAKNWVNIAGFTFQPSEFAKVLFIINSAYFFAQRRAKAAFIAYVIYSGLCVMILVVSNDLGAALLFGGTFLIVFFAATGRVLLTLAGLGVGAAGAVASYYVVSHVKTRVQVWHDPWTYYNTTGYQIVQGLMAIAAGGMFGAGLGLGSPNLIPVNTSDYIFAAICEEFGLLFGIITILLYLVFIIRGMIIAMNARSRFDALLVFGATCMLSLQSFIIIGGVIKLIPLTGITLPFISAGGSSIIACMGLVGIIEGVAAKNGEGDEQEIVEAGGEVL